MTELAFGALVVAALAWTWGNTGITRGVDSLARIIFIVFLTIAVILFSLAVMGVSLARFSGSSPGNTVVLLTAPANHLEASGGVVRNTVRREWGRDLASAIVGAMDRSVS